MSIPGLVMAAKRDPTTGTKKRTGANDGSRSVGGRFGAGLLPQPYLVGLE